MEEYRQNGVVEDCRQNGVSALVKAYWQGQHVHISSNGDVQPRVARHLCFVGGLQAQSRMPRVLRRQRQPAPTRAVDLTVPEGAP